MSSGLERYGESDRSGMQRRHGDLADVLERVLDKGIVVAGDISISLIDIELLTIKLRLLIASADKAREMGIDWWTHDPFLSSQARELPDGEGSSDGHGGERGLRERLERLETMLESTRSSDATGARTETGSAGRARGSRRG